MLSLWSGSRALNVFVDTITIMYGLGGRRGIVRTRMLSFSLYVVGLIVGVVVMPLALAGPRARRQVPARAVRLRQQPLLADRDRGEHRLPDHAVPPVGAGAQPWRYNLPGAVFAFAIWVFGSYLLAAGSCTQATTSIFGPLAAPIAILIWLYIIAIAVLIGAALNASFDRLWPESTTAGARLEVRRLLQRRRAEQGDPDPTRPRRRRSPQTSNPGRG